MKRPNATIDLSSRNGAATRLLPIAFMVLAGIFATPATASDLVVFDHPDRSHPNLAVRTVRATLIGYDPNSANGYVSPYVVVRFPGDANVVQVFLSDRVTIDGVAFRCAEPAANPFGVCPRLPRTLSVELPAPVELALWDDVLSFRKGAVLATDRISVIR